MKVVVAIDSFKGSISSLEAGNAIRDGILRVSDADVYISPIADGGEGTVTALVKGMNGTLKESVVTGPLGDKVNALWGVIGQDDSKIAIIEMAAAAGIVLLDKSALNPLHTTTYGVGELIKEAITTEGCNRFIIGIGGSATNDGGVGMLQALGFEFLDKDNMQVIRGAIGLKDIASVSYANVIPGLDKCKFMIACDVKNPLCGDEGCSRVYGPQKGATEEMIADMDAWLLNYAAITGGDSNYPGTGAAGGMGYAFKTFLNATLKPGIDIVLSETALETAISKADIVITGEGRIDSQTVMGKAPIGVAKLAKKYNKKVIAFCGCATDDANVCNEHGIDAIFPILRQVSSYEEALDKENAVKNLTNTAEQVFRLLDLTKA